MKAFSEFSYVPISGRVSWDLCYKSTILDLGTVYTGWVFSIKLRDLSTSYCPTAGMTSCIRNFSNYLNALSYFLFSSFILLDITISLKRPWGLFSSSWCFFFFELFLFLGGFIYNFFIGLSGTLDLWSLTRGYITKDALLSSTFIMSVFILEVDLSLDFLLCFLFGVKSPTVSA